MSIIGMIVKLRIFLNKHLNAQQKTKIVNYVCPAGNTIHLTKINDLSTKDFNLLLNQWQYPK